MRNLKILTAALAFLFLPTLASAENEHHFDGSWQTTVSCEPSRGAFGYSFRFESAVADSVLHGLHGTEGEPSSLKIDGKIGADGASKLYAIGHTGSKEYVPGRDTPRGTEYSYNIDAHFDGTHGNGTRVEGRPCTFTFEKQ